MPRQASLCPDLETALAQAWADADGARRLFGANGFQIRDMQEDEEVVVIETFDVAPPASH